MSTLYIIQGFLGAGKTTHSKELAKKTDAVRLNADEWCEGNFSSEQLDADWDACFSHAINKLWQDAEKLLKDNKSVVLDFGFWSRESRDHARSKARELNTKCEHYYVYAPDHILLERIKTRSGPIAENNIKNFSELRKLFEEPAEEEDAVIIRSSN